MLGGRQKKSPLHVFPRDILKIICRYCISAVEDAILEQVVTKLLKYPFTSSPELCKREYVVAMRTCPTFEVLKLFPVEMVDETKKKKKGKKTNKDEHLLGVTKDRIVVVTASSYSLVAEYAFKNLRRWKSNGAQFCIDYLGEVQEFISPSESGGEEINAYLQELVRRITLLRKQGHEWHGNEEIAKIEELGPVKAVPEHAVHQTIGVGKYDDL
jgi:hypothetical protein